MVTLPEFPDGLQLSIELEGDRVRVTWKALGGPLRRKLTVGFLALLACAVAYLTYGLNQTSFLAYSVGMCCAPNWLPSIIRWTITPSAVFFLIILARHALALAMSSGQPELVLTLEGLRYHGGGGRAWRAITKSAVRKIVHPAQTPQLRILFRNPWIHVLLSQSLVLPSGLEAGWAASLLDRWKEDRLFTTRAG